MRRLEKDRSLSAFAGQFVPVKIVDQPLAEIELPCGAIVRVANEPTSLRPVLEVLMQLKADQE